MIFKKTTPLILCLVLLRANLAKAEEAIVTDEPVKIKPTQTTKKADKKAVIDKNGDTYNFYFQKSPGAQKVKQGETQTVEPADADKSPPPLNETPHANVYKERGLNANLLIGLISFPAQPAFGVALAAQLHTNSNFGARIGFFTAASTRSGDSNSTFSAFGTDESSTKTNLAGADAALAFDIVHSQRVVIAPLAGVLFVVDRNTNETHTFSAFGSNDTSTSNSYFHVDPYIGVNGTFYFAEHFGANLSLAVASEPKYSTITASLGFNI